MPDGLEMFSSPIGEIEITTLGGKLFSSGFSRLYASETLQTNTLTGEVITQLKAYFEGKLKKFDLPLQYNGTELQLKAMKFIESIPFGETISYSEMAKALSVLSGSRAIGNLVGKNPMLIVVPCHRVIGSNGKITGYAGGVDRKLWLLQHELNNSHRADRLF